MTLRGKSGRIPDLSAVFGANKFKKAQKAAQLVARTVERHHEAGRRCQAKLTELNQLEQRYDLSLTAAALEQEGEDSDRLALQIGKAQLALEALQRKSRATQRAVNVATEDLAQAVQMNREEILAEANARILKAADKVLSIARDLAKAEVELSDLEHIKQWCVEPDRSLGAGPAHTGRYTAIQNVIAMGEHAKARAASVFEEAAS